MNNPEGREASRRISYRTQPCADSKMKNHHLEDRKMELCSTEKKIYAPTN
jgi:hypothetical protein